MSENLSHKVVKTRKPHRCFGCMGIIPAGSSVMKSVTVDCGKIFSAYVCDVCSVLEQEFFAMNYPEEYYEGEMYSYDPQRWHEVAAQKSKEPGATVAQHSQIEMSKVNGEA